MATSKLFQELLGKLPTELFFKNYWGKNWLHLKKEQSPNQHFPISIELLNTFFTDARLRYPWVKLVNKGSEIPIKEYRNDKLSQLTDIIDNDKLFEHLNKGATIVANSIDKNNGPIGIYCRELEKELSVKVWANLYISPPESRGFGIHQDIHDVIVVQLAGKKNWHIYPREVNNGPRTPGPNDIPEAEFQLRENELVYLPKNYPHMAYATGNSPSVHLSLGFEGLFWSDLVKHFAKQANEDIDFQQRVPIPLEGEEAYNTFLKSFQEKWASFNLSNHPLDHVENLNTATYHQQTSQNESRLSDWLGSNQISSETVLRKSKYIAHQLNKQGKTIHLLFHNKKLIFPIFIAPLLDQLLQEEPFKLSDVNAQQNNQEKIALAKKLLQEGLLTIVDYK
jgi:hypothetical protein